ncbi:BCNT-domain-containing protein [Ophiobolus disseminans]|uniref:SWR1-complex protein 5 n=1 Tax=Ophiobolus disseminans TaxID=1469910 RepID=A0A6A7A5J5_9PLEO|nr:BCNT-domain-containing protein [Ophiobolus disseminans]
MPLVEYADYIEDQPERYEESDDEDFNPDSAPPEEASSSSDEDAAAVPAQRKGKRKAPLDEELDSGDEVTIKAARRKKSKKQKKGKKGDDEDDVILSDGEGGLIKTRAQRRVEQVERRPLARTEGATIDVDALWAQMTAAPLRPIQPVKPQEPNLTLKQTTTLSIFTKPTVEAEAQIQISKTYTFAGQDTTEQKSIPRSHLPKYTSDGWTPLSPNPSTPSDPSKPKANTSKLRRPLRRPSRFDPNPTGFVRVLPPEHQLSYPRATTTLHREMPPPELPLNKGKDKAQKLNVVDKSRMDWTGFVDKEGIADELDTHGKTKEAYLGRMEFLAGVEARREEERKNLKAKGMPAVGAGMS